MNELKELQKQLRDLKKQDKVKKLKAEIEKYKPTYKSKSKNFLKNIFGQRGNEEEVMDRIMGI